MKLTSKQKLLLDYVKRTHGDQLRKYTNEPYWKHCYSVADIVHKYNPSLIEIALCHDLIEDTDCTLPMLLEELLSLGYSSVDAIKIVRGVNDLTDVFTKDNYPTLNRSERKEKEAIRLSYIHDDSQTVKYADLIDNTSSIVEYDPKFAKVYLKEKRRILEKMHFGDITLFYRCFDLLDACEYQLAKNNQTH